MIKAIAFDLDDTLIDTTHLLVPMASQAAYQAMALKGLQTSFEIFENERRQGALSMKHVDIFQSIAQKYSSQPSGEIAEAGITTFYNPPLPTHIPLLPGALENLEYLKGKYALFLVTSGAIPTQKQKAQATNAEHYFQKSYFLDGFKKERKRSAFQNILETLSLEPQELLAIGNRLSQEIHDAKELGCTTCYFKYGEHVGEIARNSFELPDYTIEKHSEMRGVCHL